MIQSSISTMITDYQIEYLKPEEKDENIRKMLPTVMVPYKASFVLNGVSNAISNAIRRVIMSELPVKGLNFKQEDFSSDSPYTLGSYVETRIRCIPLSQEVPEDTVFSLSVTNNTNDLMTVYSKHLTAKSNTNQKTKDLFNETIPITELDPDKSIKISNITVVRATAGNFAGFAVGFSATSVPLDVEMFNPSGSGNSSNSGNSGVIGVSPLGVSASVANPRKWRLSFYSNGNASVWPQGKTNGIVVDACNVVIDRLRAVKVLIAESKEFQIKDDLYVLQIQGETDTIGNIFTRGICDMYPDVSACTHDYNNVSRVLTIRLRSTGSHAEMLTKVADQAIGIFEKIIDSASYQ